MRNPKIMNLATKVKLEADSKFPAKRESRVTVKLKTGTDQEKVDYCKGLPQNPTTGEEFEGRFRRLASVVASKGQG